MKKLSYTKDQAQRLDAFLRENFPYLPAAFLHRCLRQGKIKVDGQKATPAHRLTRGDTIDIYLPDEKLSPPAPAVLFEDYNLLAVYKPAGLLSISDDTRQDSLTTRVQQNYADASIYPAPCHRLDTGTSGVVLYAKNHESLIFIRNLMEKHQLIKRYFCVTVGTPNPPKGRLDAWLTKDAHMGRIKVRDGFVTGAKSARLFYNTLLANDRLALLEIELVTGRTHQIRAQLASIGKPILGDSKYGIEPVNRAYRCKYQCLCAHEIQFPAELYEAPQYQGLQISCDKPWFYSAMSGGTLEVHV